MTRQPTHGKDWYITLRGKAMDHFGVYNEFFDLSITFHKLKVQYMDFGSSRTSFNRRRRVAVGVVQGDWFIREHITAPTNEKRHRRLR